MQYVELLSIAYACAVQRRPVDDLLSDDYRRWLWK